MEPALQQLAKAKVFTALVTPFSRTEHFEFMGEKFPRLDEEGLRRLVRFQAKYGANCLAVGTTGESPTLDHDEHGRVTEIVWEETLRRCICMAGCGSNYLLEAAQRVAHARELGYKYILLVDPYYNGPSSLECRCEYYEPLARMFPDMIFIVYVIPGRTGCHTLPPDLAILAKKYKNVQTVKEATGNHDNMRLTRKLCGPDYLIFSGDDPLTFNMMQGLDILSCGAISVMSNIAPRAVLDMTTLVNGNDKEMERATDIFHALKPLFDIVTVTTEEESQFGLVKCKARNPLPVKTAMNILGMPAGPCRAPLGKMTKQGFMKVLETFCYIWEHNPQVLQPAANFFNLDIGERLNKPISFWEKMGLIYTESYDS